MFSAHRKRWDVPKREEALPLLWGISLLICVVGKISVEFCALGSTKNDIMLSKID